MIPARPHSGRPTRRIAGASRSVLLLLAAIAAGACEIRRSEDGDRRDTGKRAPEAPAAASAPDGAKPAIAAPAAEDGQWTMPARDYASSRFSGLDEITSSNVASLRLAWTFHTGTTRGQEAAPIVVNGTMYIVTPYPNVVFAFDLTKPGPSVKWRHDPQPSSASQGVACCDVVNRGVVYSDGRIFFNTLDNHAIALDAETGRELWRTQLGDINRGETMTMAPLVVKGKVLVGNSGGEMGVRGWLKALDAASGRVAWTAYSTGPDSSALIGARFKPFYASDQGKDLGVRSWPPEAWKQGGGTVWGWISYDPALDLIYYGTGNPGPWNPQQRPGDNKWTSGIFARDPDTGEAVWFYQWSPHDLWDHDGVNEQILLDATIGGRARRVLVRPERNGYMYVLDRETGEVLSADPYHRITGSLGVDLETGRLIPNTAKEPHLGRVVRDVCPAAPGAKDWQPSAYSPRTGLLYVPHQKLCMDWESIEANYIAGTPFVGANVKYFADSGGALGTRGEFMAWDPVARRAAWRIPESLPVWSGALVTAGDVAFYGTMDGLFKAVDARTGEPLWEFQTGSGIIGQPVTYRGPDGKQYVAVLSGVGGWPGVIVSADLDVRDSTAANGWGAAMADLPSRTSKGGTLHVFALP